MPWSLSDQLLELKGLAAPWRSDEGQVLAKAFTERVKAPGKMGGELRA